MQSLKTMSALRVAVIGAGSAGLAVCRHLKNEPLIDYVAYEKAGWIGGAWRYTKHEQNSINTPMYQNLKTNLPKEVMQFPDYPFQQHLSSFISTEEVGSYLQKYAQHFGLTEKIRLQHEVVSVKPIKKEEKQAWEVMVKNLRDSTIHTNVFDAVVVCNGHFNIPRLPKIAGLERFPGTVIHSIDYDKPEDFQDKTVAILGARSSGTDICIDLAKFAASIYIVHLGEKSCTKYPENVEEIVGTITACTSDGFVEIDDRQKRRVNVVILCTGYQYSFPFLQPECGIDVFHNRVTPLHNHVFNIQYPSMSFVGIPQKTVPFPLFALQAQWISSVLTGRQTLPSQEEMLRAEEAQYRWRLEAGLSMHELGLKYTREYCEMIASLAEVPCTFTPVINSLYTHINLLRAPKLATYKNKNFTIEGDQWKEI